jgi:hypothetical protein
LRNVGEAAAPFLAPGALGLVIGANRLRRAIGKINDMPREIKEMLEKYAGWLIVEVRVVKVPVTRQIKSLMENLPGVSPELVNTPLYHLYQVLFIESPDGHQFDTIRLDKDEHVRIKHTVSDPESIVGELEILVNPPIEINAYFERAKEMVGSAFYRYDPFDANCQLFVKWTLEANGLLTPEIEQWIVQKNLHQLYKPAVRKVMKFITDTANVGRNFFDLHAQSYRRRGRRVAKKKTIKRRRRRPASKSAGRSRRGRRRC